MVRGSGFGVRGSGFGFGFDSDAPASLDMISGPLIRKKNAPVSLATARAMRVLPEPGGP